MTAPPPTATRARWGRLFAAWLLALFATLAVLFVGEVMGQVPCNLCWFQRAFMFPLAIVLGVACMRGDAAAWPMACRWPWAVCWSRASTVCCMPG